MNTGALDHLGLIVRTADDVDRWAAFLEEKGVTLDAKPKTHRDGARSCYFSDPDGNKIQIIHHPPIIGEDVKSHVSSLMSQASRAKTSDLTSD